MRPRVELPAEDLATLVEAGRSQAQIAEHFGIGRQTVGRRMIELGIDRRTSTEKRSVPNDLEPIPDGIGDEDRRKLVYVREQFERVPPREPEDLALLRSVNRDVLRRYRSPVK
jgi:hypothetical protein